MSTPFLSEIKIVSFNFAPKGWALCNGQLLPINQNQALFSLLGTTYGGDGRVNFALPNLQGRIPNHLYRRLHPGTNAAARPPTRSTSRNCPRTPIRPRAMHTNPANCLRRRRKLVGPCYRALCRYLQRRHEPGRRRRYRRQPAA